MAKVQFDLYFYHPDHLSSSSWITDISGTAIQHLQYLPFGESRVDQRTTIWNSRYSFSAKEKDEESGYGYFGARYYDSDLSIWLSVDPMASKYPMLSPYCYTANNPIKLIDPNGMEIENSIDELGSDIKPPTKNDPNKPNSQTNPYKCEPVEISASKSTSSNRSNTTIGASQASTAGTVASIAVGTAADLSKAEAAASGMKEAADVASAGDKFLNGMKVGAKWLGRLAGGVGVLASATNFYNAETFEGKAEAGMDVMMNGIGLIRGVGTGVSLFWNFGGKTLHKNYVEKVLTPQAEMGIIGLPSVQPFK